MAAIVAGGCDDPAPDGPIGSLVVIVRAAESNQHKDLVSVRIHYGEVQVDHVDVGGTQRRVTVDAQQRSFVLPNSGVAGGMQDVLLGQFPVPVGSVTAVRVFGWKVDLTFADGTTHVVTDEKGWLPSWMSSGWKFQLAAGTSTLVEEDKLSGLRAEFDFATSIRPTPRGWKLQPELQAVEFLVHSADDAPGPRFDQLTLVLRPGTSEARLEELAALVQGRVLRVGRLSNWHRIQLSSRVNVEQARDLLSKQADVIAAGPGLNLASDLSPGNDLNSTQHALARVHGAWDFTVSQLGRIGSSRFPIAVVEIDGIDVAHPSIYRNIFINQGELPPGLFDRDADGFVSEAEVESFDLDPMNAPDGLITIRDLEALPSDSALLPPDANANGRIDCIDIVKDPRWADGVDNDEVNDTGLVDDICGWDFGAGDNVTEPDLDDPVGGGDPGNGGGGGGVPNPGDGNFGAPGDPCTICTRNHATAVAGVIGSEGRETADSIAGILWHTAIVPIKASGTKEAAPSEAIAEAIAYVNRLKIPVANFSQGWSIITKDASPRSGCGMTLWQSKVTFTDSISISWMRNDLAKASEALMKGTKTLLVFSAGNVGGDIGHDGWLTVPASGLKMAAPDRVLIVGNATRLLNKANSNYGSLVDVWAPGDNIAVLTFDLTQTGTSAAAPFAAGVLGLRGGLRPGEFDAGDYKRLLVDTARPDVTDTCFGAGVTGRFIDAEAFVRRDAP